MRGQMTLINFVAWFIVFCLFLCFAPTLQTLSENTCQILLADPSAGPQTALTVFLLRLGPAALGAAIILGGYFYVIPQRQ